MLEIDKYMYKPFFEREPEPCCPHPHPHEKPRYTMTEEMEHTARLMRETIDRLLKFEQRVKTEVADLSKNLCSDNVIFKNAMHESWNTFLMEVKNEINIFEGNIEADLRLFKSDLETNYANLSEDVNGKISDMESRYETAMGELKESIQEQYNSFVEAVNSRIDANNETMSQAFADYQRQLNTQLNTFEQTMNNNYETFTESIGNSWHEFKESWEQTIATRFASQDGKISDAEAYMKTNLEANIATLIGDMHANGEFTDIIEGELFNDLMSKLNSIDSVSPQMFGAIGDGIVDDTGAFKVMLATKKNVFVPSGKYLIKSSLDATGVNISAGVDAYILFNLSEGYGLKCGYGNVQGVNLVMMPGFKGDLFVVGDSNVDNYPDKTRVENVNLFSMNTEYEGTYMRVKPHNNYGGNIQGIRIGRTNKNLSSVTNKAENGFVVEIPAGEWATGYSFKDIIIDAYALNPLTLTAPDYNSCMNFMFKNVQIQTKHNNINFVHNYMAKFSGVKDLYLSNCKIWDYSETYTENNVVYKDCSNVVIRNSPTFERYFSDVNPFTMNGSKIGFEENLKLYNSAISNNNGYVGQCEPLAIDGSNSDAIPYFIPFDYSNVLYSKMTLEMWSRLNYSNGSGDTLLKMELMQTSYLNNIVYANSVKGSPVIKRLQKYKEGIVVWIKGGIGTVYMNYVSSGKATKATGRTFAKWDGTTETVIVEAWSDTDVIPVQPVQTIINGEHISKDTVIN